MTDTKINIAIAEAVGFVPMVEAEIPYRNMWSKSGITYCECDLPDYCHDLNAMHEAEMILFETPTGWNDYAHYVFKLACNLALKDFVDFEKRDSIVGYGLHCPARQRAEAWLRCKGLWREDRVEAKP
jgi:hypothetical protein